MFCSDGNHIDTLDRKITCLFHCIHSLRNCTIEVIDAISLDICVCSIPNFRVAVILELPSNSSEDVFDVILTISITTNTLDLERRIECLHQSNCFFCNVIKVFLNCFSSVVCTSISDSLQRRVAKVDLLQSDGSARSKIVTSQSVITDFLVTNTLEVEEVLVVRRFGIIEFCRVDNRSTDVIENDVRECCRGNSLEDECEEGRRRRQVNLINNLCVLTITICVRCDSSNTSSNLRSRRVNVVFKFNVELTSFKLSGTRCTRNNQFGANNTTTQVILFNNSEVTCEISNSLTLLEDCLLRNCIETCERGIKPSSTAQDRFIDLEGSFFVNDIDVVNTRVNNSCSCFGNDTSDSVTQKWEDTTDAAECQTSDFDLVILNFTEFNSGRCFRCFSEDDRRTRGRERINRCLCNTVDQNEHLSLSCSDGLTLNIQRELSSDTIEVGRNIVNLLNDRCQNFLRVGQTLLSEQNFGVIELSIDWLCVSKRGDLVNVSRSANVDLFDEVGYNLTTRNVLTTSDTQFTEHIETNGVVCFENGLSPVVNRCLRLNNVGEVLIEVGILDLLNDFGRFAHIIDELTRSFSQRCNVQSTFCDRKVINQTRCTRHLTSNTLALLPNTIIVFKFQDTRTNLPTFVSRNITSCRCEFQRRTLINQFTLKESGSFHDCFCLTTEHFGKQHLTTFTLSQECDVRTRFCVKFGQCNTKLVRFEGVLGTSNCVVSLIRTQANQTCRTRFRQNTNNRTEIFCSQLHFCTSCNAVREVKLQITQVNVNNVVKFGLQGDSRFRRVTRTRVLDDNFRKSVVLDDCFCFCTRSTATSNNHSRN